MTSPSGISFWARQLGRDEAVRSLPLWILVTVLNTSVATGVVAFRLAKDGSETGAPALVAILWLALAVYLAGGRNRARCSHLDATLPLASRGLWLLHLGATVGGGLVILAASFAVIAAHEALVAVELGLRPLLGPLAAGLVLVAVVTQSFQRDLREPARGRFNLLLVVALVVVPLLSLPLLRWPLAATLAALGLAAGLGYRSWSALPPSFRLATTHPSSRPGTAAGRGTVAAARSGPSRSSTRTLFAILHHAPPWGAATPWVLYLFILLVGFVIAGGLSPFLDDQILRVIYLPLASYSLFSGLGLVLYQSFRLDPLPVPRARLFALLMLPTLAVFLVGFAATRLVVATRPPAQLVAYNIRGEHYWVDVPLRYLSVARADEVPMIEAPWGESHPGWSAPLFQGSDRVVYSPFNTAEPSSARFEALLTSRAVEAIYGKLVPPDEILTRYFAVENDRPVGLRGRGLTLLADHPDLEAPRPGPELPVYVALVALPWLLVTAAFFRAFRAPSSDRRVKRFYWGILTILLALMLGQGFAWILGWYNLEGVSAVLGIAIRRLGESAATVALTWVAATALLIAGYLLALAHYRRAELPATPIRLQLIDFATGDS